MMFGSIRGMAGGNNKVDVPSATFAWDKIARTQLVYSSNEYNVPLRKEKKDSPKTYSPDNSETFSQTGSNKRLLVRVGGS
jgi:hypothetical protein